MKILLLVSVFCTYAACGLFAQEKDKVDYSADWATQTSTDYTGSTDILEELKHHDLSSFWLSDNTSQNGVYGPDYWRIEFYISDASQENADLLTYRVKGKDRHKGVVTPFEGTITITKATRYTTPHVMNENVYPIEVVATYNFIEDPASKYSGVFSGTLRTDFVYKKDTPDEFELDSEGDDGYMNNTYVGTWTSKSGKKKKCIWGLERLPYTHDWDEGAGEIYINKKYLKNGWESYMKQVNSGKPGKKDEWWK